MRNQTEAPKLKIARAHKGDVDLLVRHRLSMFEDLHPELKAQIAESKPRMREWIARKLGEGKLVSFIIRTQEGEVAGSGCLWLREEQPRIVTTQLEAPYLMSVFTEREFRRRGVASLVVKCAIAYCRGHGYDRIHLHAAVFAKPVYERYGFEPTNEMRLMM